MSCRLRNLVMIASLGAAIITAAFLPRLLASPSTVQHASVGQQGQKDFEQRALAADRAFVEAASKSDTAALEKMLDMRFTWTDANGNTLTRQEVLRQAPKPAISDEAAQTTAHNYGSPDDLKRLVAGTAGREFAEFQSSVGPGG